MQDDLKYENQNGLSRRLGKLESRQRSYPTATKMPTLLKDFRATVTVPSLIRIAFKIIVCFQRHDVPLIFILYR